MGERQGRPGEAGAPARGFDRTRYEQYLADVETLKLLPYKFLRLGLTAAGNVDFKYKGNSLAVMRLVGATPELRVRLNDEGNDSIAITSEGTLKLPFDRIWLEWDAIAGGVVDLLFSTEVYGA